jgi:hypothetical protein
LCTARDDARCGVGYDVFNVKYVVGAYVFVKPRSGRYVWYYAQHVCALGCLGVYLNQGGKCVQY